MQDKPALNPESQNPPPRHAGSARPAPPARDAWDLRVRPEPDATFHDFVASAGIHFSPESVARHSRSDRRCLFGRTRAVVGKSGHAGSFRGGLVELSSRGPGVVAALAAPDRRAMRTLAESPLWPLLRGRAVVPTPPTTPARAPRCKRLERPATAPRDLASSIVRPARGRGPGHRDGAATPQPALGAHRLGRGASRYFPLAANLLRRGGNSKALVWLDAFQLQPLLHASNSEGLSR